jgi:mannose-6-phosphate isomerase
VKPLVLPPNVQHHFYAGGRRIAELRGLDLPDDHTPEEWIGAVNAMFGQRERGLSRLEDGTLVRDAIAGDPESYLGPEHVARWGADAGLLVKLLDAGQRLPVHFHPGRVFAKDALGLDHGKTESWIILEAEPGAVVHAGFAEDVSLETVRGWMADQDSAAMLAALRELAVAPGDAIFVPGGTPHAIGEGILLVELQEPTDLSINLEWAGFPLTSEASNLGLGWDRALEALDRSAWDDERLAGITRPGAAPSLLGSDADPYFRAERLEGGAPLDAGFSILVVTEGKGTLRTVGGSLELRRGTAVLVPYAAGEGELDGDLTVLRSRPADPSAPEAE